MFNFQGSELIIILLLALVVLGPEKLPEAMRKLGGFYADLKKMSTGFQEEFRSAVDEPLRELRDTANSIRDSADFRKLQDGEREEKPKSAEMSPAAPADTHDDVPDAVTETDTESGTDGDGEPIEGTARPSTTPTVVPPPPKPFSSSQQISAAPAKPADPPADDGEQTAVDSATERPSGSDDATPNGDEPAPKLAVEREHGLRESMAADPPIRPEPQPKVAVEREHGLRESMPAEPGGADVVEDPSR